MTKQGFGRSTVRIGTHTWTELDGLIFASWYWFLILVFDSWFLIPDSWFLIPVCPSDKKSPLRLLSFKCNPYQLANSNGTQSDLFGRLGISLHHAFHRSIITLVQPLSFKDSMSWTLIATITIGFFVGLATLLECLWLGRCGSYLLAG